MMTRQEMFNKAWHGVIAQGGPSNNKAGTGCAYRGEDGKKCGVGHLIDDTTARRWDRSSAPAIGQRRASALRAAGLPSEDKDFLRRLQNAHDDAGMDSRFNPSVDFVAQFQANMREVADRFNLTMPEVGP